MSETTRLGVSITATDTNASASINALRSTISSLQDQIGQITRQASQWGGEMSAAAQRSIANLQNEISAIQAEISARTQQVASVRAVTAAIKEQGEVAAVVHRSLQAGIDAAFGVNSDRAIKSATESARVLSTSLSAAAEADARLRNEALAATAALERQGAAVRTLTGEQFFATFERQQGIGQQRLSAERSAAAFASQLGPAGLGITSVDTRRTIDDLHGINREMLSARESAAVFAQAFPPIVAGAGRATGAIRGSTQELKHLVAGFDELASNRRGAFFSTIGAALRDAGLGATALTTSVVGLVAVLGTGAILRHAEALGKWAADTRAAASAAGMSTANYSQLQGALVLTGQKADEADATLRRLAVNLGAALASPTSLAAQAFHNLGISQEQLAATGGDLDKLLPLLADAFVRTADGANKSANFAEIAGRGYQNLFKLLQNGNVTLDTLKTKAKELGLTLTDDTAASLQTTGEKVEELTHKLSGDLTQAFINLGPLIQGLTTFLSGLTTVLSAAAGGIVGLGSSMRSLRDIEAQSSAFPPGSIPGTGPKLPVLSTLPQHVLSTGLPLQGGPSVTSKAQVPPLVKGAGGEETVLEKMRHDMAQAEEQASRGGGTAQSARQREAQAEIAVMQHTLQTAQLTAKQREQVEEELAQKQTQLRNEQLSAGTTATRKAAADQIAAIKEGAREAEDAQKNIRLDATLGSIAKGTFAFQGQAKAQGPAADIARSGQYVQEAEQVRTTAQEEIEALRQVEAAAAQGSTVQKAAAQEILNVTTSAKAQEVALYEKAGAAAISAINKINSSFEGFFNGVGNQFESLSANIIKDLIAPQTDLIKAGLTTIKFSEQGNELRTAFRNAIVGIASDFGKSMETAIGHVIANALSSGAANSIGELLSQTLSKAVGGITGNAAGSALSSVGGSAAQAVTGPIVASITASSTANVVATQTGALTGATATQTGTGLMTVLQQAGNALLAFIGVNVAAKPSVLGTTYSMGGIVPSAAGGMVGGTGATLAILHAREMVLPAPISQGLQSMIARGGNTSIGGNTANLSYSPTINAGRGRGGTGMTRGEFAQMMALHGGSMLGEARNMVRAGFRG